MKANYNTHPHTAKALLITAMIFLAVPKFLHAQNLYKVFPGAESSIKVLGTSNVHDWTMTSTGIQSSGEFLFDGDKLVSLKVLTLSVDVKSLKSEHSSMDNRTYKAINAKEYPKITYKLTSAVISIVSKNKYLIKTKGDLNIAGANQLVAMDVNAIVNSDNTITCTGVEKLKLTDYNITPPSFMLGAMKVYNDLTIQFNLIYKK
jgi:polyisoprenoid-binding protein YceI